MDGDLFECDRGIERVNIFYTSNLRIRDPLTFNGPMEATLSLEVIDTLAIDRTDTICVTAIDSAGNSGEDCAYWPSAPDGKSPVFIGKYDRGTAAITGIASDDRENDRGLGSVTLRGSVNLDNAFGMPGLRVPDDVTVMRQVLAEPARPPQYDGLHQFGRSRVGDCRGDRDPGPVRRDSGDSGKFDPYHRDSLPPAGCPR